MKFYLCSRDRVLFTGFGRIVVVRATDTEHYFLNADVLSFRFRLWVEA